MITLVTGDDETYFIQLTKEGSPFTIANTAVVKMAIVTADHKELLSSIITCSHLTPGANWAASLIAFSFPANATQNITPTRPVLLEIEVNDSKTTTWFEPIKILKGLI